jgi:hypothetical protein
MSRDPNPLDELAKALADRSMTRRAAIAAFAGAMVAGTNLGGPHRNGGRYLLGPAKTDASLLPAASEPVCEVGAGLACSLKCALVLAACAVTCIKEPADCGACKGEVIQECADCDEDWDCQCPGDTSPCGPLGTVGGGWICCDPGQTCFPPGICQGPCDPQCEVVTIIGCISTCPSSGNSTCCKGVCVDIYTDPNNCGGCGNACEGGQTCQAGQCDCPNGQTLCSNQCVNTSGDPSNCGGCGIACTSGSPYCVNGGCAPCPSGETMCPGGCADLQTDLANCGSCGNICQENQVCEGGQCACPAGLIGPCADGFCCPNGCCAGGCLPDGTICCGSAGSQYVCAATQTCCTVGGSPTCCE